MDNLLTDINSDRPNLISSKAVYTGKKIMSGPSSNAQYLNPSAFAQNAIGTFGDVGRNAFRGPYFIQVDSALGRFFPLHESVGLDLRLERHSMF